MEKETEEQTSKRVCDIVAETHYNNSYRNLSAQDKFLLTFEIAKLYHSERIKQLIPSSVEIREVAKSDNLKSDSLLFFVKGAKWMRNKLLTKVEK